MDKIKTHIFFALFLALFYMAFAVFYQPTFGYVTIQWTEYSGLCIPIITAIVFVVVSFSRLLFWLFAKRHEVRRSYFMWWQIGEIIAYSFFVALFVSLLFHLSYFGILPTVLLIAFAIGVYPYVIHNIILDRSECRERMLAAEKAVANMRQGIEGSEEAPLQFLDEKGVAKLLLPVSRIFYIESSGNYVTIVYDDDGRVQRYALRNTLKGIETLCLDTALVRCHRSFYINIGKIKLLRKDAAGTFAEMQHPGLEAIPVSATYLAAVAERFSAKK